MSLQLAAIHRYPVKSCRGSATSQSVVERWGLAGDRRWLVVDTNGHSITAREVHRLLLVHPHAVGPGLRLSAPDLPALDVVVPDGPSVAVDVWGAPLNAVPAGTAADAWFTAVTGRPARLVYLADPTQRRPNQTRTAPTDRVSFADGYPLLLTTEASLAALNEHIVDGPRADEGPLPMARFRPNVVVAGGVAWDEDDWRRIRIGEATFRAVKGCDRCVMTTVDPDTAASGKEPITSLARHRRWDGKTWFGINLVPDEPGTLVRVGDQVEIIEAVASGSGPLR